MMKSEAKPMKLSRSKADELLRILISLPDNRHRRGRRHGQVSILAVAICAVLCGARSYVAIAEWAGRCNQNFLKRLDCRKDPRSKSYMPPSEATIRRVLQGIDAEQVDRVLSGWLQRLGSGQGVAVAIDGKTLRGAQRESGGQVHLLSAMLHGTGVILGQCEVEEKSNEIPAAPQLLGRIELGGVTVTADALHTQSELAKFLKEKGADYVLTVKDNQATLKQDIAELFASAAFPPSRPL